MINVTVWCEFIQEREDPEVAAVYPHGIHEAIAAGLRREDDLAVTTASLDQPDQGLSQERLDATDVLIWWGHKAHARVEDATVDRVQLRANDGMGLILLHSSHVSRIMTRVLGTRCSLRHREIGERERVWNIEPNHPITQGIGDYFEIEHEELYGERFDIPQPDELIFISWFEGGEVFRSGSHLPARQRQDLLLPAGPRDLPHLLPAGDHPRAGQRRALGEAAAHHSRRAGHQGRTAGAGGLRWMTYW